MRVLVVEDSPAVLARLKALLEEVPGLELTLVGDADGARAAVGAGTDLIVLDLHVPGARGLELLEELVARAPALPVAVLSNAASVATRRACLERGALAFLDKSSEFERVVDLVERMAGVAVLSDDGRTSDTAPRGRPTASLEYEGYDVPMEMVTPAYSSLAPILLERFADALVVLDGAGRIEFANAAARTLLVEDAGEEIALFAQRFVEGGPPSAELILAPLDAPARVVSLLALAWGDRRVVVTARDITALQRLEEEAKVLRRFESLGLVTASVLHDLNNVLAAILGLTAVLKLPHGDAEVAAIGDELRAEAARGSGLIGRVLGLVRHRPPASVRVDVNAAVGDLVPLLERLLGEQVEFVVDLESGEDEIAVDRERLDHALINLVANARDAMPSGGRLTIATRDVALPPAPGSKASSFVAVSVTDTGTGMTDEVAVRAFERFFTTKAPGYGTGLGLCGVQQFVAESGGRVTLVTAPGAGTTVSMYLPRLPAAERSTLPPPSSATLQRSARGGSGGTRSETKDDPLPVG